MGRISNIIVIDDDRISNLICEKVLRNNDFAEEIKSFTSAEQGLAYLDDVVSKGGEDFPDAVFLDINMPEMDGWDFLEVYKKYDESLVSNCKLFMLSSSIDKEDIGKAKTYNQVLDYIIKPISTQVISKLTDDHFSEQLSK